MCPPACPGAWGCPSSHFPSLSGASCSWDALCCSSPHTPVSLPSPGAWWPWVRAGLEPSPAALLSPWALAHLMAAAGQHGLSFLPLHAPEAPTAAFSVKLLKAFFTGVMIFSTMASESYLCNFKLLPEVSLTLLQLMLSSEASLCSAGLPVSSRLTLLFWTISFTFWFFFFFFYFFLYF